ncbi:CapA family protein [Bradyrhizobium sp. CCGUVB14]|uniref:CapA family protein n=1 Tax=Bradyrhizobium sp. CCGUVB14 TaxID=2949628 RepID=UPI0020B322E1|nr:CapA family protein [Bradyrhizobium sp. CCGUVB14]MCP3441122.1 CapA family protein [Bradyrhizobium sp. CCGUVB14]
MPNDLLSTPCEISQAEALAFESEAKAALEKAESSGDWDYPRSDAATDSAEMIAADWAYWLYKLARPTVRAERNVQEVLFSQDKSVVRLPNEFETEATVTIGAAGDLMPLNGIELSKDMLFESVADILFDVDISLANLEAPVTQSSIKGSVISGQGPQNPFILQNSVAQFSTLVGHRGKYFTALNFANNHTFDLGIEGLETTQKLLAQNGITIIGTPRNPKEYGRPIILTREGVKIGFISATFGLNGRHPPSNEAYRIHTAKLMSKDVPTDLELLNRQIDDCKKQYCDFIVASIHWGFEFEFFPRSRQIEAAHKLVEEGVDLIWGHHPHVIQPLEYYRTKRDPNRIAVIAYSLGGLTFDEWDAAPHLLLGLIVNLKLAKGFIGSASRTYIENINPIPVFQNSFWRGDARLLRIEKLEDHQNGRGEHGSRDRMKHIDQIKEYADLVLMKSIT